MDSRKRWPLALLLVALFRTSAFVFIGAVPGLALWHLYELLTGKERIRQLAYLATTALVALALALPLPYRYPEQEILSGIRAAFL